MRKTPRFTATALLTLAVCLGANLTIFAVVDSILLRPLPFPAPDRLVTVFNTYPKAGVLRDGSSTTNYYERRGRIPAFSDLAIYSEGTAIVGETGATERVPFMRVSPEFFSTLGANPAMGRSFTDAEMAIPPSRVVILSDNYWRRNFNADPLVIGQAGPGCRSCEHRRGRSSARLPLFIVGSAAVFSLCVASRRSRAPGAAFGWEFETHHRSPQTWRHAGTGAGSD